MGRPLLWLAASLDVEEEGLFGGKYVCRAPSLRNTAFLSRLAPLLERGLRPTLFCTHCALTDAPTQAMLARLRDRHGAEIAAHLHFWNTPPLADDGPDVLSRVPAAALGQGAFRAKLRQLLAAGAAFQGEALRSFRMGRWDLHRHHWPVLAEQGITCDASIRPLHGPAADAHGLRLRPDHFSAPRTPYLVRTACGDILEVPLSVTPLLKTLPALLDRLPAALRQPAVSSYFRWGALTLLPVEHPLRVMQYMTRRFVAAGGRILSLTWHSSEMMPGGAPHMPDEGHVTRFLEKIKKYIEWLPTIGDLRSVTMQEIRRELPTCPAPLPPATADWSALPTESFSDSPP
ncbi:glycosyl transferase family 1 [uncultured Desulfovibrio sp.]|uniref:glycosyl transferase family 1 n=1 Tax=uncultured Desulfovibrio sp. TaxID=167968 RepID=UPI00261707E3|nr:glycosyl transferase family 1 [uncultured Desulfovibrio sp.]